MTRDVKLDKKDRIILSLTHDSQETSQGEIAKKIHLSQPSVAIQIKKLKERGFINHLMGVNLNKVGLSVAMLKVTTTNPARVLNVLRDCPFFLNGFIVSGKENLVLLFVGEDISSLESIIDTRIRLDEDVQSADFDIVISSIKDFIIPIKMLTNPLKKSPCGIDVKCADCSAYQGNRCFGCPATSQYKGIFW